jgi:hypothetical protein
LASDIVENREFAWQEVSVLGDLLGATSIVGLTRLLYLVALAGILADSYSGSGLVMCSVRVVKVRKGGASRKRMWVASVLAGPGGRQRTGIVYWKFGTVLWYPW